VRDWFDALDCDGYAILPAVFDAAAVSAIIEACTRALTAAADDPAVLAGKGGPAYGARNLLRLWPGALELARSPVLSSKLLRVLGNVGGVVRALFFDKPPGHSWALPWHKDFTIAVKAHGPIDRFEKPTVKAGVPHVEAPVELLATMLTARVHLDPMFEENGALRVIPGSHRGPEDRAPLTLQCAAGDVLLMRPLLVHGSGHCVSDSQSHRRVVHLECAPSAKLPDGYEWHDFLPLIA
jgi:ectoine hydroxylase-related dioxygenase (phytanoyl-CoA dioxygenase family)